MDRKPSRFNFMGKRITDHNYSLKTPIIVPNAPLSGPHFPSFDHQAEKGFGQYLQELSQSVSSAVFEKRDKPTTLPTFPSPTTSSIPTPAIKYNRRHQQSQQSQSQNQTPSQPQSSAQTSSPSPAHNSHSVSTTNTQSLSRINEVPPRLQFFSALPSSSIPTAVASLNLSNHSENTLSNTLSVTTEDLPSSSSRSNHTTLGHQHAPFSPVSTMLTSSQASIVGKESVQYIVPSGSEEKQTSRATPGLKKKMNPGRRSKLTKKKKLDRIIQEEKRLQASNSALKQKIKVMQRDFSLLENVLTYILIDAAKRKRSESLRSRQEGSEDFKETAS